MSDYAYLRSKGGGHEMFKMSADLLDRRSGADPVATSEKVALCRRLLDRHGHSDLADMLGLDEMESKMHSEQIVSPGFAPRLRHARTTPKYRMSA
jgi:hypothetical protein